MNQMKTVRLIALAVLCLFFVRGYTVSDVKIHQKTQSSGFAGIGATEGEETLLVKALMQKQVSSMKFTQGLVKFFAGSGPKVSTKITRVDKELLWNIDDEKKTYTETTFAKLREQMKEAEEKAAKEEKKDGPKPTKPGRNVIFSTRIEVTEAAVSPVLEAEFTVPAGYELKD